MSTPPERPWPLEMLSIALSHPWLLAGTLIPAISAPAIEPAQAWLAKTALDRLTSGQDTLLQDELIQFLPLVVGVGMAAGRGERDDFHQRQEHLFGVVIRFEVVKQAAEVIGDMTQWLGLAVILLISPLIPIIPHEISAGALAAFLVNLKLIGKPVQELGKMYIKLRESYPAVLRVLQPHRALALDLGVAR